MKFMILMAIPRIAQAGSKYSCAFPNEEDFDTAYLIGIDRFVKLSYLIM